MLEPTQGTSPSDRTGGRVYAGRYAVEGELGRGGMGQVLRARDLRLGRAVALKVLTGGVREEAQRRRFEQEARAAGALNHPNILAVHDVGEHEGEPFLVSELLEGRTLRAALPLARGEALGLALQLASGLAAAHRHGIVHRDVKPENLFLTSDGQLKILDFGIAKLLPQAQAGELRTDTGAVLGTPAYMSPEQVRGEAVDARSDVFSCGVVLHELLSGARPFAKATPVETAYAVLHDPPPALPGSALAPVVARCLEKDPAARYPDGAALHQELTAITRGLQTQAGARARRRAGLLALAGLLGVVALGVLARRAADSRPGAAPSQNLVVVLPFTVRGTGQSAYLGEGMVDLLSTTLGSSITRAVNAQALLAHLAREKLSPDPEGGRKVAARFGARQFVLGSVVEVGSRLRIHATVYDADRDEPVREAKAEGESARIFEVVDDLSAQLRAGTTPPAAPGQPAAPADRQLHVASATTSSPEALRAFLEGIQEQRRWHGRQARAAFARAVQADPSFALAQAWEALHRSNGEPEQAAAQAKRALELSKELPHRDQLWIAGMHALMTTEYSECERFAREILRSHPDDIDAHHLLSITLHYGGAFRGVPYAEVAAEREQMAALSAQEADQQVVVLDLLIAAEFDRARALIGRELARGGFADESVRLWARWTQAILTGDHGVRQEALARLRSDQFHEAGEVGNRNAFARAAWLIPGGLEDAEAVARISLERAPKEGHITAATLSLIRGRLRLGYEHLQASAAIEDQFGFLRLLLAGFSTITPFAPASPAQIQAERAAIAALVLPPSDLEAENRLAQLNIRGQLAARAGDAAEAEKVAAELERAVIGLPGSTLGPDWALAIRATLASRSGRLQDALSLLERIRGRHYNDQLWTFALPPIRWARSELLFLLGRDGEAERFYLTDQRDDDGWYLAPRLRRLGQIADRRGERVKAVGYYRRFVELWSDCDPELRPFVDEARARQAALR